MGELDKSLTFRLFTRPSFMNGMSCLFNTGNLLKNYKFSKNTKEADAISIFTDWQMIGCDIQEAMDEYEQQAEESK